ncbi:MAG: dihydroorotate dehydrogenase electron transfer subunit [Abditibacteriaceae bacterium]
MVTKHAHRGIVVQQTALSGDCYLLLIEAPRIAKEARAGQFVHVLSRPSESTSPLLRRAFSIMTANEGHIEVLYRALGCGTVAMSRWKVGQKIDLLGPLGKPFAKPQHPLLLVGGGVGTPPLVMLAWQTRQEQPKLSVKALIAAKTTSEVLGKEEFLVSDVDVAVATDDGSEGHHGFVTELLEQQFLETKNEYSIYACGPLPMLRAVAALCEKYKRRALLSLEENMPCGIGVCSGCSFPVLNDENEYGQYARICVEGPSLWSDQIDWAKMRS